jgi:hypothetical protein
LATDFELAPGTLDPHMCFVGGDLLTVGGRVVTGDGFKTHAPSAHPPPLGCFAGIAAGVAIEFLENRGNLWHPMKERLAAVAAKEHLPPMGG